MELTLDEIKAHVGGLVLENVALRRDLAARDARLAAQDAELANLRAAVDALKKQDCTG